MRPLRQAVLRTESQERQVAYYIRNFVEDVEMVGDEATLTYTIPMPNDGVARESTSVLDFVQLGVLSYMIPEHKGAPLTHS